MKIFGISFSILGVLLVLSLSGIIGGFCWTYTINSWLVFAGKPHQIVFWDGFVLGYVPFFGQWSLPCAFITWILLMFMG